MDSLLYVPIPGFPRDDWFKASLLVWDRLHRVVTESAAPDDSHDIRMAKDRGLVRNIVLEEEDIRIAGQQFLTLCNSLRSIPAGLHVPRNGFDYFRSREIDERSYPSFNRISQEFRREGWLWLSKALAEGYMHYLSKVVAQRRALVRGTGDRKHWSIAPYFVEEANFNDTVRREDADGYYCTLLIDGVIPASVADITMPQLVQFVDGRREERSAFRNTLQELIRELSSAGDLHGPDSSIRETVQQLERDIAALRHGSAFWKQGIGSLVFGVGVPVSRNAIQSLPDAGNPFDLHRIAPSLYLGAVAAYADYGITRHMGRDRSFVSFILETDRPFSPQVPVHGKYFADLDQFING